MNPHRLFGLFRPRPRQLAACFALSAAAMMVTYGSVLFDRVFRGSLFTDSYVKQVSFHQLVRISDIKAVSLTVEALFWGGVGLAAYITYLAITNAFTEARNELVIETSYTNKGDTQQRLGTLGLQVGLGLAVFAFLALTALVILPVWLGQFEIFLTTLPAWSSFLHLLVAWTGFAVNLYGIWLLLRAALAVE